RSYLKFLMFVSLFHQLVAGPIVRYAHIENEINHREHKLHDINQGILRFCIGLFKKVFIADVAGSLAMAYLGTYDPVALQLDPSLDVATKLQTVSVAGAWFGIIMFSIQIYFDFSGYSDMAIGLGRMFGFHYHENFNYPYIAKSAKEFWRRWHISLGTFFRDYIYIPLGGNRKNAILNLFIVWFLTGLWHGSSWNFVLWGLYFGVLIYLERLFLFKLFKRLPNFVSHVYLILIAILGWGIFYFEDWGHLSQFFAILFGDINWTGDVLINTVIQEHLGNVRTVWDPLLGVKIMEYIFWIILSVILCMPIYPTFSKWLEGSFKENHPALYTLVVSLIQISLLIISIAMLTDNTYNAFIYFRF
ncbi:MAG: MBOAT family protein, partial [Saprospiraceae bacterium]|nr:MBOAT family protein [Saprospiraceae bacterium]